MSRVGTVLLAFRDEIPQKSARHLSDDLLSFSDREWGLPMSISGRGRSIWKDG